MKQPRQPSRRQFCATAVAVAAAGRARLATAATCNGPISAGSASSVSVGTYKAIASYNLFLCRDAQGFFAMSSACPHAGCTVSVGSTQITCACHGATFDLNGQNPTAPANAPLAHYALSIDAAGNIYIDNSVSVSPTTRAT